MGFPYSWNALIRLLWGIVPHLIPVYNRGTTEGYILSYYHINSIRVLLGRGGIQGFSRFSLRRVSIGEGYGTIALQDGLHGLRREVCRGGIRA